MSELKKDGIRAVMSESVERDTLKNMVQRGETVSDKDKALAFQLVRDYGGNDNAGLLRSETVKALATVRREAREEAFKEAIKITRNARAQYKNQSSLREAIIAALERAAESGEGGDDG